MRALTAEDYEIFLRWSELDNGDLFRSCRAADRRDADLMFMAAEIARAGPCSIQLFGIDCRGWTQR